MNVISDKKDYLIHMFIPDRKTQEASKFKSTVSDSARVHSLAENSRTVRNFFFFSNFWFLGLALG